MISKVGYGIVSDCIANGVALLYPPRSGFREDEITLAVAPGYVRMRRMSIEDFRAGRWRSHVLEMLNQPEPAPRMRTDGDQVIANGILRWIS